MRYLVLILSAWAASLSAQFQAQPAKTEVELVAISSHAVPGETVQLAFRFRSEPKFHIYWKNPGDAGEAPKWTWIESAGLVFAPTIGWPAPIRYDQDGIMNFVHEGETYLFVSAKVPTDTTGKLQLKAKVEWLECDDKGCYPQEATVELTLPVGPTATATFSESAKVSLNRIPTSVIEVTGKVMKDGKTLRVSQVLEGGALAPVVQPMAFFPLRNFVAPATLFGPMAMTAAPQTPDGKSKGLAFANLSLEGATEGLKDGPLGYVAEVKDRRSGKTQWVEVRIVLDTAPTPAPEPAPAPTKPAIVPTSTGALDWKPWSPDAEVQALAEGKIVYIDFTARWCATCQVNKRVYSQAAVLGLLSDPEIVIFRASWDKRDETIREALASYGRQGIPLNVFLRQGSEPVILPEILTANNVTAGLAAIRSNQTLPATPESSLTWMLLLALGGGAILNLMPCVFPVIGLKVLSFAGQNTERRAAIRQSLVYAAGVIVSFIALGVAILALKAGGDAVGWGFQMQSPTFVLGTAILMVILGMSLAGAFEMGAGLAGAAASANASGAFLSGVLATAVATPCTAPGLGAALGFALDARRGSSETLLLFAFAGLGMALPYVLLVTWPALARRLPKPGEWMETLKQAMAFPLFGYAVYLLWVLSAQVEDASWVRDASLGLVVIAAACWIWGRWGAPHRSERQRLWGRLSALGLGFATLAHLIYWLPA